MQTMRLVPALTLGFFAVWSQGCGTDEAAPTAAAGAAGSSGASAGGSLAGRAGASGNAGAAGGASAGTAGGAGNAGASGNAGAAGGASAGTAGAAGSGANGGSAGVGSCVLASECNALLPAVIPVGCAEAICVAGTCQLRTRDQDGDGFRASKCQATGSSVLSILLGDDCDDERAGTNPGAWDGPAAPGKPSACGDGIDQDCSGKPDDDALPDGTSCTCTPGDARKCAETAAGVPIVFPGGTPAEGSLCRLGSQICVVDAISARGVWSVCSGAQPPGAEICDGLDNDCDGAIDEGDALDRTVWRYDGDGDGFAAIDPVTKKPFAPILACTGSPPKQIPEECTAAYCGAVPVADCCPAAAWKTGIEATDCNDRLSTISPKAAERCGDSVDQNCDGTDSDGFSLASPCDLQLGNGVGACPGGGALACSSVGSAQTICARTDPEIGTQTCRGTPSVNGSYDWDCDGNATGAVVPAVTGPGTFENRRFEMCRRVCYTQVVPGGDLCNCSDRTFGGVRSYDRINEPLPADGSLWAYVTPPAGTTPSCGHMTSAATCTERVVFKDCREQYAMDGATPLFTCSEPCGQEISLLRCQWKNNACEPVLTAGNPECGGGTANRLGCR